MMQDLAFLIAVWALFVAGIAGAFWLNDILGRRPHG